MKIPSVTQVMSKEPLKVKMNDDLIAAYEVMQQKRIRHLPVVDDDNNIVGVISHRDFQRVLHDPQFKMGTVIKDQMSWPVKSVSESANLLSVSDMMIKEKISAVLVAHNNDDLVGIITHEDLLRVCRDLLEKPSMSDRMYQLSLHTPIGQVASWLSEMGL